MAWGLFVLWAGGSSTFFGNINAWLESIDVDANDGRGRATFTHDSDRAMRFPDFAAAMACWKQQSTRRPFRPDGKPNRPLTAYTVEPRRLE